MILSLGSGDTTKLLSGKITKGFGDLLRKFVAEDREYWNSFASPIDALRTGAILEIRYLDTLEDGYFCQYKSTCKEFDCLTGSLDFAKIEAGKVVDFDELKTIFLTEYIDAIVPLKTLPEKDQIAVLKKKFKNNYNQVQFQLLCSGLDSANLVFLSVESYEDDENYMREIKPEDYTKFRIHRDEMVIAQIMERATIFQVIKDFCK